MNNIKILDCTLRDGGYQNEWKFGYDNERKIINSLVEAEIDIIECGLLVSGEYKRGISKFTALDEVKDILPQDRRNIIYTCLMNYGEFDVENLPICDGKTIDGIRVAFHKKDINEAVEICKKIKKKGYKLFMQPMVSLSYKDEEFLRLIEYANEIEPYAFYIVDSFGMMKRKDIIRLFYMVEHNLSSSILIGTHLHNNLQLAYANAQALVDIRTSRTLIIDTSIMGMGRGAGNLNTELFVEYINDNLYGKYRVKPILQVVDEVLNVFYEKKYWGYSLPNYLSASYKAHPNYAAFLADKNTLTVENMAEIFSMIDEEKKVNFDKIYIEEIYLQYMSKGQTNEKFLEAFKDRISGKTILLIAPGRSSEEESERVVEFASRENVVSIGINFSYNHFETDFIFISNFRRFQEVSVEKKGKMIVTSNIAEEAYLRVDYRELLNEYETIKDNAAMMLIRFLIKMGVKEIFLAGLDGYSHDTDQNYAEEYLQLVTRNDILDTMNEEMNAMLKEFSKMCKLEFVTKCRYLTV